MSTSKNYKFPFHFSSSALNDGLHNVAETADLQGVIAACKVARVYFIRPQVYSLRKTECFEFGCQRRRVKECSPRFARLGDSFREIVECRPLLGIQQLRLNNIIEHDAAPYFKGGNKFKGRGGGFFCQIGSHS